MRTLLLTPPPSLGAAIHVRVNLSTKPTLLSGQWRTSRVWTASARKSFTETMLELMKGK
jgi:hypothetical protein